MVKNYVRSFTTIGEIEKMLEIDAVALAEDKEVIKGHDCYFVDFGGYFGYSVCVFCDGRHIYYANDYELHHNGKTKEELREWYVRALNHKLYTEEELAEPLKSYDEYVSKRHFLTNYYPMRRRRVSIFGVRDDEDYKRRIESMFYNPVCFCYSDSSEFVKRCVELDKVLEQRRKETADDYDYQKAAFYSELANHEYHINPYQGDWDTLSAFGSIRWRGQGAAARQDYYAELGFNDTQIRAFEDARQEFLADAAEKGWY